MFIDAKPKKLSTKDEILLEVKGEFYYKDMNMFTHVYGFEWKHKLCAAFVYDRYFC